MTKEELKDLGYYIIRTDDGDRYYWEVYADDEMIYIASHEEEAEEYLSKITAFIQKQK